MTELGELKTVQLRTKWTNEARDFTPWLAENIELLSEAIGVELEVENIEVAAGTYSADILAKDTGTGKYVVIENQLVKTNHDHLGKAITYASVLDASIIVWIAPEFTDGRTEEKQFEIRYMDTTISHEPLKESIVAGKTYLYGGFYKIYLLP